MSVLHMSTVLHMSILLAINFRMPDVLEASTILIHSTFYLTLRKFVYFQQPVAVGGIDGRRCREIWEEEEGTASKHHNVQSDSERISGLTRDRTAEPVSRDQILRREWVEGGIICFHVMLTTSRIDSPIPY